MIQNTEEKPTNPPPPPQTPQTESQPPKTEKKQPGQPKLCLFIGPVLETITDDIIESHFLKEGLSIKVKDRKSKRKKKFIIAEVDEANSTADPLDFYNTYHVIDEHKMRVRKFRLPKQKAEIDIERKVFVGNLPFEIKKSEIYEFFGVYGSIKGVYVKRNSVKLLDTTYAFITFDEIKPAVKLREIEHLQYNEWKLSIQKVIPNPTPRPPKPKPAETESDPETPLDQGSSSNELNHPAEAGPAKNGEGGNKNSESTSDLMKEVINKSLGKIPEPIVTSQKIGSEPEEKSKINSFSVSDAFKKKSAPGGSTTNQPSSVGSDTAGSRRALKSDNSGQSSKKRPQKRLNVSPATSKRGNNTISGSITQKANLSKKQESINTKTEAVPHPPAKGKKVKKNVKTNQSFSTQEKNKTKKNPGKKLDKAGRKAAAKKNTRKDKNLPSPQLLLQLNPLNLETELDQDMVSNPDILSQFGRQGSVDDNASVLLVRASPRRGNFSRVPNGAFQVQPDQRIVHSNKRDNLNNDSKMKDLLEAKKLRKINRKHKKKKNIRFNFKPGRFFL